MNNEYCIVIIKTKYSSTLKQSSYFEKHRFLSVCSIVQFKVGGVFTPGKSVSSLASVQTKYYVLRVPLSASGQEFVNKSMCMLRSLNDWTAHEFDRCIHTI